jgi:hypothetical protein
MIINNYAIIKTSRQNGAQFIKKIGDFNENEELLAICLPFGEPGIDMVKLKEFNNDLFLTCLHHSNNDYGYALIIKLSHMKKELLNPMAMVKSIKKILDNQNIKSVSEPISISIEKRKIAPIKLRKFETIISSILMGKKNVLLGTQEDIDNFIYLIFESFPQKAYPFLEFSFPTNSLSENTFISGVVISDSNYDLLDGLGTEKHSIVYFDNKECYGLYSSPFSKKIAKYIQKQEYKKAKKLIQNLFSIANQNSDIIKPSTLARQNKISVPDASLILNLRAKIFDKQPPMNIFEKLIY